MSQEMFIAAKAFADYPGLPPVLKKGVDRAAVSGGLAVGMYLAMLSDDELLLLLDLGRQAQTDENVMMPLTLFSVMLANGESLPVALESNLSTLVRNLLLLVQVDMLCREGLCELAYSAMTLEKVSVETIPLTAKGREKFGGLSLQPVPIPPGTGGTKP